MVSMWVQPSDLDDPADPHAFEVCEAVSYALWQLSGQRFGGVQEVTEWYGRRGSSCYSCSFGETFVTDNGHIFQPHGHRFYSGSVPGLRTSGKPIVEVISVETSEGLLPSAAYQVTNRSVLYLANKTPWDFNGGVTVTYRWGQYPPTMGRMAAVQLANEFLLDLNGSENCALPSNVTSVTRLGLSFTLSSPAALAAVRMTGLPLVDLFLSVSNPAGAVKKSKVFSPDKPKGESYSS